MPAILWSLHAEQRRRDRPEVTVPEVEDALLHPDEWYEDPQQPGRWIAHKYQVIAGTTFLLRVFAARPDPETLLVVSYYRTTQLARYGRTP